MQRNSQKRTFQTCYSFYRGMWSFTLFGTTTINRRPSIPLLNAYRYENFNLKLIGCPGKVQRRDLSREEVGQRMVERRVGKQNKTRLDKKTVDVLDELLLQLVR